MKRNFLKIRDFSVAELEKIILLAEKIKKTPDAYRTSCAGKNLGVIFEKPSTRTRVSFQVGIQQLGGFAHYLAPNEIQLGKREEIKDVARTLSRYLDVVVLRTFKHETISEFAEWASIPVINGLSDYSHPCQAIADYLTIKEKVDNIKNATIAYIGDGNNVLHSLLMVMAKFGVSVSYACPKSYTPSQHVVEHALECAHETGARIQMFEDPKDAVKDADVIYTDVFVSMGEESERDQKMEAFQGYQVNADLLQQCAKDAYIMHCLPAHRGEEITDEVIESSRSIVFDQAENRMHAQKGVLHYLLND